MRRKIEVVGLLAVMASSAACATVGFVFHETFQVAYGVGVSVVVLATAMYRA